LGVARGAIDLTQQLSGKALGLKSASGETYFRPTVLLMDHDNPLLNTELPFPFVSITQTGVNQLSQLCSDSLIVSLIGEDTSVFNDLVQNPSIDKVFAYDSFDRGYNPLDAHEGLLSDFIFKKKTVCHE
jgi:hypothetical protein